MCLLFVCDLVDDLLRVLAVLCDFVFPYCFVFVLKFSGEVIVLSVIALVLRFGVVGSVVFLLRVLSFCSL